VKTAKMMNKNQAILEIHAPACASGHRLAIFQSSPFPALN
jgi:hypothetical protein